MIESIRQFPVGLIPRIGYFLHQSISKKTILRQAIPRQWKVLAIDFRSATIGFATALIGVYVLSPASAECASLNQWILWMMVIGLSTYLVSAALTTEQTPPQHIQELLGIHNQHPLERVNQQLWNILTKQAIAKQHLQATNERLLRLATTDGLTQVKNRYFFDRELQEAWTRSQQASQPISIILFDVDHFKKYNDYYGHQAGDRCLQDIAHIAQHSIYRSTDFVARYGGEEFAVVLTNTPQEGAIAIAHRIQKNLQNLAIPHLQSDVSNIVSISLGIASTIPAKNTTCDHLVALADQALYHAKQKGRDRHSIAP